jgi:copper chaperone CopZ
MQLVLDAHHHEPRGAAGVASVDCDHASGKTVVTFDDSQTDVASLATTEAGYAAEIAR